MVTFEQALAPLPEAVRRRISSIHRSGEFHGVIEADDANALAEESGLAMPQLMTTLLPVAALYARPPISNFRVGCIARGASGNLYYGANLEFPGEELSFTVHAEQSSVMNAWIEGESSIEMLAVTAAPCGYCRQFLRELDSDLAISVGGATRTLAELLPFSFGPGDLGVAGGLMRAADHGLTVDGDDPLVAEALDAANRSYAPYTKAYAGVAVRAKDGRVFTGRYAENAAFNPSMSPLEGALARMNLGGYAFDDIAEAVLVEAEGSMHADATRVVLGALTQAPLRIVGARNGPLPQTS